ncbi:MAG: hypothetical protein IT319_14715 [Anaerolineae bacterium]|nr:hypothetical protein [Anaerolineae bacterium]
MSDFFKKLNVLIKASLNDIASSDVGASRPTTQLGKNVDADVSALRERVNDAVRYEDEIKAQIAQLEAEVFRWDSQADEAVARSDDAGARYAIEQMHRAEQRIQLAHADLREHQWATQELIQRVNTLDAAVADAHHQQPDDAPRASPMPDLTHVLREARATITSLAETAGQRETDMPEAAGDSAVDDDLERRRQRLSKR